MIDALTITNFKSFSSAEIPLGAYTLLSGLNSSGKSTVLQALALLRQAEQAGLLSHEHGNAEYAETGAVGGFPLNGELVELGTGQDILHEDHVTEQGRDPEIGFALRASTSVPYEWRARYGREDDLLPLTVCRPLPHERPALHDEQRVTLFNPGFQYLGADRINPAVTYPQSHEMAVRRGFLGTRGEYTIDYLRHYQDETVPSTVLHHPDASRGFSTRSRRGWGDLSRVKIAATAIDRTDLVRLGFEFTRPRQLDQRAPADQRRVRAHLRPAGGRGLPDGQARRHDPAGEPRGARPPPRTERDGPADLRRRVCGRAGHRRDPQRPHPQRRPPHGEAAAARPRRRPAALLPAQRRRDRRHRQPRHRARRDAVAVAPGFFDEWDRSLDQLLD